jgi:hypothetical protein
MNQILTFRTKIGRRRIPAVDWAAPDRWAAECRKHRADFKRVTRSIGVPERLVNQVSGHSTRDAAPRP